jgi:hypothetical protein
MNTLEHLTTAGMAAISLLVVAGCSTPKPALEQANHTAKLMSQLDLQLDQFRSVMGAAEQARLSSMLEQRKYLDEAAMRDRLTSVIKQSAGDTEEEPLKKKLLAAADFIGAMEPSLVQSQKDNKARLDGLLTPLPSTSADMTAAQAAATKMGTELSRTARFDELKSSFEDIRDAVKEDVKTVGDARQAAAKTDKSVSVAAKTDADNAKAAAAPPAAK